MGASKRLKILLNHPLGYVLIWIVAFGLIALSGRNLAGRLDGIGNEEAITLVIKLSAIVTVIIAISIIAGGFRISHLENYTKKSVLITCFSSLVLVILSAWLIRQFPASLVLILINGLLMIIFSFTVGELLSREVLNPGHLIPVALVLALVDFWSVISGPSRHIAKEVTEFAGKEGFSLNLPPPWASFLLLRYPQFVIREIYSFVGVGDLVIIAFLIGCIHRFNLPKTISYSVLIFGTALAVLIANLLERPLPVLPVIALLFVVANHKHLSMKRNDWIVTAAVIIVIVLVITLISFRR